MICKDLCIVNIPRDVIIQRRVWESVKMTRKVNVGVMNSMCCNSRRPRNTMVSHFYILRDIRNTCNILIMLVSIRLSVWLFGVFRSTWAFFTHMETSPLPVKGCRFWPGLGTHSFWEWGFFSVLNLLWNWTSVYTWEHVTLAFVAELLAMELSLPVFTTYAWNSNTLTSACEANALTDCANFVTC